jgi:hypothetical protein
VGLFFVVAIVGVLAKKPLGPGVALQGAPGTEAAAPAASPRQQVQQFEQAVQGALQQARSMPDEEK